MKSVAFAFSLLLAVSVATLAAIGQAADPALQTPAVEKAFIANAGGDFGHYALDYTLDAERGDDRAYGVFFADMKKWGGYEIVATPARADWIFQINVGNSSRCVEEIDPDPNAQGHTRIRVAHNDDWVDLVMMDVKTMEVRRRFVEHIKRSSPFSSYETSFDRAVSALIDDVKEQLGKPGNKTPQEHLRFPAPVPPQISSAQTVFLHDIGENDDASDLFSGGGARVYQEISQALKNWGRYELVAKAAQADLILEVSFLVHRRCDRLRDPRFRLFIRDPKTEALLWGLTTHAGSPLLARNERKAFDNGAIELVNQLRALSETPTWLAGASLPAALTASGTPTASSTAPVSATVSASAGKSVVKSGSEVRVEIAVKNVLERDLDFSYPEGDPLTCMVEVRDSDGKPVPVTEQGRKLNEAHATWQGRSLAYSLHPGETKRRECAVSELYDMSHTGRYFIQAQQLDGRPAQSNTLMITVVP